MTNKYSADRLEKSRFWFLEPKIESGTKYALKSLQDKDMSHFVSSISTIDKIIEHHIINNCAKAENEELRMDCINKAENMKTRSLNRLSEALTEKCGGEMTYIDEE